MLPDPSSAAPRHTNRLARSSSPYLLQHAHNPVDWWAWSPEAHAEARSRNVPIFLSIGYSTCYWCHVMERESFEHQATADLMNQRFVNIKLDREERPDLDDLYMAAVQMMTGSGGWPMSVFLEPDTLRPFWGGTYFPPRPMHGRPSFSQVLTRISDAYKADREGIRTQAKALTDAVAEKLAAEQRPVLLGPEDVQRACTTLLTILDPTHGGFGRAPKFPQAVYLELLLATRERAGDEATRAALDHALRLTLDKMAVGGLFDHLAGGFHRYSTDHLWLVPHFEKMLYDQAQLLPIYARAAVIFNDAFYRSIAELTADYVLREMRTGPGNAAFSTAQDAEVDGREGQNYLWTAEEFRQVLPSALLDFALRVFGVSDGPNFQDPHHPSEPQRNVLWLRERPEVIARVLNLPVADFDAKLGQTRDLLLAHRRTRKQPRLDDKVLTAWNGHMIAGLATAAHVLHRADWLDAAETAARFVLDHLSAADGSLLRTWRLGEAHTPAMLEDYAHMIAGLLAVGRATSDVARRQWAIAEGVRLLRIVEERYVESGGGRGGYFDTHANATDLFVRPRATYDGATPSGGSVMLSVLIDLHELTGDAVYLQRARRLLATLSPAIKESPVATALATTGLLRLLTIDANAVKESLAAQGARRGESQRDAPVQIFADASEVAVGVDAPGQLLVRIVIAEGYHINAYDAAEASGGTLIPLRVDVIAAPGLAVYADYPPGDSVAGTGHRVHHGEIEFPVVIERQTSGLSAGGSPKLVVSFQACTQQACQLPQTLELDVQVNLV